MAGPRQRILNSETASVTLIAVLAVALRLALWRPTYMVDIDGVRYLELAKLAFQGKLYLPYFGQGLDIWPPVFPVSIAIVNLLVPDMERAAYVASALWGGLVVVPSYLLARSFYGRTSALITAGLVVFFPPLVDYSSQVLSEMPYTCLTMLGVFLGWKALQSPSSKGFLLTGLVFGLSYLTRWIGLANVGIMALVAALYGWLGYKQAVQKVAGKVAILLLGVVIVVAPYVLYTSVSLGRVVVSENATPIVFGRFAHFGSAIEDKEQVGGSLTRDGLEFQTYRDLREKGLVDNLRLIAANPQLYIVGYLEELWGVYARLLPVLLMPLLVAGMLLLGIFGDPPTRDLWRKDLYVLLWIVLPVLLLTSILVMARYLIPLLPLLLIWAARGIDLMGNWLQQAVGAVRGRPLRLPSGVFSFAVLALVVVTLLPGATAKAREPITMWDYEQRLVGEWMKEHLGEGKVIMHRKAEMGWYAGMKKFVMTPYEPYDRVMAFARLHDVDYLVISQRYAYARPLLSFLLDEKQAPAEDLRLVYKWEEDPKLKVLVYKVQKKS